MTCSARDLLNITDVTLALNSGVTLEKNHEYTITIMSSIGDVVTRDFVWTDMFNRNFSQLPYQLVGVSYTT